MFVPMNAGWNRFAPAASWIDRWSSIMPLLAAEFVVWLGFGSLLPVMPLYFRDHGVDLATLGVVIAAWPAARLVGEPVFGWIADRTESR
jgi:MFS family permease